MSATAAQLVDRVLPDLPVRQWVLSVPFEMRMLLACRADAFGALTRIFVEEIARWQQNRALERGIEGARSGAVSFQQRFGGSLNLNCHPHVTAFDGVFTLPDPTGIARSPPAPPRARQPARHLVCAWSYARRNSEGTVVDAVGSRFPLA